MTIFHAFSRTNDRESEAQDHTRLGAKDGNVKCVLELTIPLAMGQKRRSRPRHIGNRWAENDRREETREK